MGGVNRQVSAKLPVVYGKRHYQPPAFTATGKGWFNRVSDLQATAASANGVLINRASAARNPDLTKMYLFVYAAETGYTLSGDTTQAQHGRTFYPKNLAQDDLVIEGIVASQYEYDRLVQFVQHHHDSQIVSNIVSTEVTDTSYTAVDFLLYRPTGQTFDAYNKLYLGVVITDIQAGHERFKNYPTYQLTCKIVKDYLQKQSEVWDDIYKLTTRQQVFGTTPSLALATRPKSTSKKTKKKNTAKSNFNHRA